MSRAPYACDPETSRGRLHPQAPSRWRSAFQRDRDRIIHATAFRRLKHKTQVFVSPDGDHFRTRLTHSLEVAQIARSIARALGANEDLTEALALAHDLGHTAFGHAGEEALHTRMRDFGGFDHNAQALRIVTELEQRHIGFDGLNLTWETLEGLVKHNGPLLTPARTMADLPWGIAVYVARHDLQLHSFAGLEAQIAAIADDIAYNAHDLDDGLRAGLFTLADARSVPLVDLAACEIIGAHPAVPMSRLVPEIVRDLIGRMIGDVLLTATARLAELAPAHADDIRHADTPTIQFSPEFAAHDAAMKKFLHAHMYRHPDLAQRAQLASRVIHDLFDRYVRQPDTLPPDWAARVHSCAVPVAARTIADFIAGMTDRYAITEFEAKNGPLLLDGLLT